MTSPDVQRYREALQRAVDLQRRQDFEGALQVLDELLGQAPYASALHLHRARLLQLSPVERSLEEVEQALTSACALDDTNIAALLEMGHFIDAVRDRPGHALERFTAAAALAASSLKDALLGRARCLLQLGERAAAEEVLREAQRCFPEDTDVELLGADLADITE